MKIEDEILGQLRAHRPFREIRSRVRSISKLYQITGQYLDELEVDVEDKRAEKSKLEEERADLEVQVQDLRVEAESRSDEIRKLDQEIARKKNDLSERAAELSFMQTEIDRFREQGFSSDIMHKLKPFLERSGPKLLEQVEDVEEYQNAMKEFSLLKRRMTCLRKKVRDLEKQKKRAQDCKASLENQTDELRLQVRSVKDAVNTVYWLLKRGYTVEDVRALGYGLEFLEIEGDPDGSITRLVKALKRQTNLAALEERAKRKNRELEALEETIENRKTTMRVEEEVLLRHFDEVKNASGQSIKTMSKRWNEALTNAQSKFEKQLQAFFEDFRTKTQETIEQIDTKNHEQSVLEQQKAAFKETLAYGQFLQNLMSSDQYLSMVPSHWILRLSRRLHLWIKMKLPNEHVFPSGSMRQLQLGLLNFPYKLSIVAELLCSGLETAASREPVKTEANLNPEKQNLNQR